MGVRNKVPAGRRKLATDISMPAEFPMQTFRAFGIAGSRFFPAVGSQESFSDQFERTTHFNWSWQAVRYRYRTCSECANEFRKLVGSAGEGWLTGTEQNEELTYRVEACIYLFFVSALSVFESLGFCLYFLGAGLQPVAFPLIKNPKSITLKRTADAYKSAFPHATISKRMSELLTSREFCRIDLIRNLLAHRLSGRKSVRGWTRVEKDTIVESRSEITWHIPGSTENLEFNQEMLQVEFRRLTRKLRPLLASAKSFAASP